LSLQLFHATEPPNRDTTPAASRAIFRPPLRQPQYQRSYMIFVGLTNPLSSRGFHFSEYILHILVSGLHSLLKREPGGWSLLRYGSCAFKSYSSVC
jgi:hypothetical protein